MLMPERVTSEGVKINALIYGLQGVGKTSLAATAQDHESMSPVLFLNLEGGLLSVAGRGDIQAIQVRKIADLEEVLESLKERREGFEEFKTVVIDSGSEMYQLSLREAVAKSMDRDARAGKRTHRVVDDVYLEDYGTASTQMGRLFREFRDLDLHTIITALPRDSYYENTQTVKESRPDFSESLARHIMGFQDFVWYMFMGEDGKRSLLTSPKGTYRAKTRGPKFAETIGQVVESPTLPELYDLLQSSEGSS